MASKGTIIRSLLTFACVSILCVLVGKRGDHDALKLLYYEKVPKVQSSVRREERNFTIALVKGAQTAANNNNLAKVDRTTKESPPNCYLHSFVNSRNLRFLQVSGRKRSSLRFGKKCLSCDNWCGICVILAIAKVLAKIILERIKQRPALWWSE